MGQRWVPQWIQFNLVCVWKFELRATSDPLRERSTRFWNRRKCRRHNELNTIESNWCLSSSKLKFSCSSQLLFFHSSLDELNSKRNDLTGDVVLKPAWGRDQPNNYNGEQNCAVLDGGRNWLWNDVGCNLDYLHFICQHSEWIGRWSSDWQDDEFIFSSLSDPLTCGSPDSLQNTTVVGRNYSVGALINYSCPKGHALDGNGTRQCLNAGIWSGAAPMCKCKCCLKRWAVMNRFSFCLVSFRYRLWWIAIFRTWFCCIVRTTDFVRCHRNVHMSRELHADRKRKSDVWNEWMVWQRAAVFGRLVPWSEWNRRR